MTNESMIASRSQPAGVEVLHVFAALGLGGAEARTMDVFRAIRGTKVNFNFVTMVPGTQHFTQEILDLGGTIFELANPRDGLLKHLKDLWAVLKQRQPDVVHAHTSYHSGLVLALAKLAGVRTRIAHARVRGVEAVNANALSPNEWIGKLLIRFAATDLIATSPEASQYLFGEQQSTIIPNAFPLDAYLQQGPKDAARPRLNLPSQALIVGQVGRLDEVKNHSRSLRIFHRLRQRYPGEAKLVFVGTGEQEAALRKEARELGVDPHVIFAGLQVNVAMWLEAFDVLLMPSIYEGLGNAVVEAQASGLGVVASSSVPSSADLGLGLVDFVPLGHSDQVWVDAILRATSLDRPSPEGIKRRFAEQSFTLEAIVTQYLSIYSR